MSSAKAINPHTSVGTAADSIRSSAALRPLPAKIRYAATAAMKQAIAPMLNTSRNANALNDSVTVKRMRCHFFSAPHTSAIAQKMPMA